MQSRLSPLPDGYGRIFKTTAALILTVLFFSNGLAEPRQLSPAPPGPLSADEIAAKIRKILTYGRINIKIIEEFVESPLIFIHYQQTTNAKSINSKSRHFTAPGTYGPVPFTSLWYIENFSESTTSELRITLNESSACITREIIQKYTGLPDEQKRILREFSNKPADNFTMLTSYKPNQNFNLSIEFESRCAKWLQVKWKDEMAWTDTPEKLVSDAEFIKEFLPLERHGGQLEKIGMVCRPDDSPLFKEIPTKLCRCPETKNSGMPGHYCNYIVKLSYWPNGNVLSYVEPLKGAGP